MNGVKGACEPFQRWKWSGMEVGELNDHFPCWQRRCSRALGDFIEDGPNTKYRSKADYLTNYFQLRKSLLENPPRDPANCLPLVILSKRDCLCCSFEERSRVCDPTVCGVQAALNLKLNKNLKFRFCISF